MSGDQDFGFENVLCRTPHEKFCKLVQPLSNQTNQAFHHHNFLIELSIHMVTFLRAQIKKFSKWHLKTCPIEA